MGSCADKKSGQTGTRMDGQTDAYTSPKQSLTGGLMNGKRYLLRRDCLFAHVLVIVKKEWLGQKLVFFLAVNGIA